MRLDIRMLDGLHIGLPLGSQTTGSYEVAQAPSEERSWYEANSNRDRSDLCNRLSNIFKEEPQKKVFFKKFIHMLQSKESKFELQILKTTFYWAISKILGIEEVDIISITKFASHPEQFCQDVGIDDWLISSKDLTFVEFLKQTANYTDKDGRTYLHLIHPRHSESDTELLLSFSALNVNEKDNFGQTPLHIASEKGLTHAVRLLLASPDIQVNITDNRGCTPLRVAVQNDRSDIVQLLLAAPNIHLRNEECSQLINIAQEYGSPAVLKVLLQESKLSIPLATKNSLLQWAVMNNHPALVKILLKLPEIDLNPCLLSVAVEKNYFGIVTLLLEAPKINVRQEDDDGKTAFFKTTMKENDLRAARIFMLFGKVTRVDIDRILEIPNIPENRKKKLIELYDAYASLPRVTRLLEIAKLKKELKFFQWMTLQEWSLLKINSRSKSRILNTEEKLAKYNAWEKTMNGD